MKNSPSIICTISALVVACGVVTQSPDDRKVAETNKNDLALSSLVPRSKWGGGETGNERGHKSQIVDQTSSDVKYITIHNFVSPKDREVVRMNSNRAMHINAGYGDIAYHYIVGDSGKIYEGRRPTLAPASYTYYLNEDQLAKEAAKIKEGKISVSNEFHAWTKKRIPGNIKGHVAVSFMCGGRLGENKVDVVEYPELLEDVAMRQAAQLIAELLVEYKLKPNAVRAHREFAVTNCPNDKIYEWLRGPSKSLDGKGAGMKLIEEAYRQLTK